MAGKKVEVKSGAAAVVGLANGQAGSPAATMVRSIFTTYSRVKTYVKSTAISHTAAIFLLLASTLLGSHHLAAEDDNFAPPPFAPTAVDAPAPAPNSASATNSAATPPAKKDGTQMAVTAPLSVKEPAARKSDNGIVDGANRFLDDKQIKIASAGFESSHDKVANLICLYINHSALEGYDRCLSIKTGSDLDSINALRSGNVHFAVVGRDFEKYALSGTGPFNRNKFEEMRAVVPLYQESLSIAVKSSSDVKKFEDLTAKKINVSPLGTSSRNLFDQMMKIYNLNYKKFRSVDDQLFQDQILGLCNEKIDTVFVMVEQPNENIRQAGRVCEIDILALEDGLVERLTAALPEYQKAVTPGGLYVGIPFDISTVGLDVMLMSSTYVSDKIVKALLTSLEENEQIFKMTHTFLKNFSLEANLKKQTLSPQHNGVATYLDALDAKNSAKSKESAKSADGDSATANTAGSGAKTATAAKPADGASSTTNVAGGADGGAKTAGADTSSAGLGSAPRLPATPPPLP